MLTLHLLNKELIKPRNIYTETFYVSINEDLVLQKKSEMANPADYSVIAYTVDADEFPVSINGTVISSSTESFLDSPFTYKVEANPEYAIQQAISAYISEKLKLIKSGGLNLYFYIIPQSIAQHPFIEGAIAQAGISLFVANTDSYVLHKTINEIDTVTNSIRTEFQLADFRAEVADFNSYIKEILEYVGDKHIRDGLSESDIIDLPETQAKITEILSRYLANK